MCVCMCLLFECAYVCLCMYVCVCLHACFVYISIHIQIVVVGQVIGNSTTSTITGTKLFGLNHPPNITSNSTITLPPFVSVYSPINLLSVSGATDIDSGNSLSISLTLPVTLSMFVYAQMTMYTYTQIIPTLIGLGGKVTANPSLPNVTYTAANIIGEETLSFNVVDSRGGVTPAKITFVVNNANAMVQLFPLPPPLGYYQVCDTLLICCLL